MALCRHQAGTCARIRARESQATHDGRGNAAVRPHDELGGRRDLVGHVDLGALQHAARVVALAGMHPEGGQAGAADGGARRAQPERPAERVGDDHAHLGSLREGVAETAGGGVGVDRKQDCHLARARIGAVDARGSAHEAMVRLADQEGTATADDARALAQDQLDHTWIGLVGGDLPRSLRRRDRGQLDAPPLDLRDGFLRDADDVAVTQAWKGPHQQARQVVSRLQLGQPAHPGDAEVAHARERAARTTAAELSVSRISVGTQATLNPSARTSGSRSPSASSSTKPVASGARTLATPTAETSWPSVSSMPASGPLTASVPIIGVTAITRSRRASTAARSPSTARMGSSETNGLEGASTITSACWIASSTPGAGRAPGAPSKRTARTGSAARRPTSHSWKASSPSGVTMRVRRRSSVAGSKRAPRP